MLRCFALVLAVSLLPSLGYSQTNGPAAETAVAAAQVPTVEQPPGGVLPTEDVPQPPETTPGRRGMRAYWDDGLTIENDDATYQVRLGAFLRVDGRFVPTGALDGDNPDTLTMRLARVTVQGRITKWFTYRVQPDFTSTVSPIADAFIDLGLSDAAHIRIGRDKVPIGFENQLGDANLLFMERGMPQNLTPSRDVGVQYYGTFHGDLLSYVGGMFNGAPDGSNATNVDTDNGKEFVGRIISRPFTSRHGTVLEKLGLGLGLSRETQRGVRPSFKTSSQEDFFSYAPGVVSDGLHTRFAPQLFHYYKTLAFYSDYVRSKQVMRRGDVLAPLTHTSWQLAGAVILTGETAGERVRPRHAFDPDAHTWGALQMTARYGYVDIDEAAFTRGFASSISSQHVKESVFGLIWFMTTNVKALFNYEHARFEGGSAVNRAPENAYLWRMQLNF